VPKTRLGEWSLGLIAAFLSLLLFYLFVASGQRRGETFFSNLILAIPALLAGVSGGAAFLLGL
jgi:hypothetical protein